MVSLSNHQIKDVLFRLDQLQSQIASFQTFFSAALQQSSNLHFDEDRYPSRPMTKSELASLAHVTTRTLAKWLKPLRPQLRDMGVPDQAKVLPADAVRFVSSQLHITIDENDEQENGNKLNFPQKAENT